MNERQKIQHLFQFDMWCNHRLTDFFQKKAPFSELTACSAFLSHIINVQEIWFLRVVRISADDVEIWTEYELGELKRLAKNAHQKWIDLIGDHEVNLDSIIHYNNGQGKAFHNPLRQIAHHLIVHGQYHRAQISLFLKKCDITPPSIDYMNYSGMARP